MSLARSSPRHPSVHLDVVRTTYHGKVYEHYYLRSIYREGDKVKYRNVGNLSGLPSDVIDVLHRALKGERFLPAGEALDVRRSLPHGDVAAVLGTARRLGLEDILDDLSPRQRKQVVAMVVARVLHPASDLASCLQREIRFSTLGSLLDIGDVDDNTLCWLLDRLGTRREAIEHALAKRHITEDRLVLYDLTSARRARAGLDRLKDNGSARRRLSVWLVCTPEGIPVGTDLFPCRSSDTAATDRRVRNVRRRFGGSQAVLVGNPYVPPVELAAHETVPIYTGLSQAVRAFRGVRDADLRVSPLQHRAGARVSASVLLCMLAYHVEWHMRRALGSILLDDDRRDGASAGAGVEGAAAICGHAAQPAHTFRTLLHDLRTICKNTIVLKDGGGDDRQPDTFEQFTTPTPFQKEVFDLLGLDLL